MRAISRSCERSRRGDFKLCTRSGSARSADEQADGITGDVHEVASERGNERNRDDQEQARQWRKPVLGEEELIDAPGPFVHRITSNAD